MFTKLYGVIPDFMVLFAAVLRIYLVKEVRDGFEMGSDVGFGCGRN